MTDRFGPRPRYADLPVADLAVDSSYQRSIELRRNQAAIERICEGFRWSLFGVVTVTKGLVGYLIIDGQHRTEAARRLKIETVPCLVVPPISRKDQALAFVAANRDRVPVTQFAIHHALVAAGDEKASALAAMCSAAGVDIPHYPIPANKSKPEQTLAIGALAQLLEARGQERGAALLGAVRRAFASDQGALRAPIISALAAMDQASPLDPGAVERVLKGIGHRAFEKRCALLLIDGANSKTRAQAVIAVLTELLAKPHQETTPPPVAKAEPPKPRSQTIADQAAFIRPPSKAQLMGRR
jgi:hypothetical protein